MRILSIYLLAAVMIAASLTGAQGRTAEIERIAEAAAELTGRAETAKVFSAADGSFELTATDKWSVVKKPIEHSFLNIENNGRGASIAVFRYSKEELAPDTTLETFSKAMQLMFLLVSEKYNPKLKESTGTNVGSYPAFEYEGAISSGKAKVRYLFINLETPTYFYKLGYSATTRSGFNKLEIRELLVSFKEIEATPKEERPNAATQPG